MHAQHTIPEIIEKETLKALSYYPDLKDTKIELRFKKNIKKSTMQARPSFASFFRSRKNRSYLILISETFKISDTTFLTKDIPSDILIGKVKSYQLDQAENFYTVEVELFNDMTSLDHVYIIDNKDKTQIENLLNNSNDQ